MLGALNHVIWDKNGYPCVAGEILGVECEDVGKAMTDHRRHEPGVVSRFSAYPMRFNKMFPLLKYGPFIAKEAEEDLDFCEFRDDFVDGEAQAIFRLRPSADDPEFIQHLRNNEPVMVGKAQALKSIFRCCVMAVRRLCKAD